MDSDVPPSGSCSQNKHLYAVKCNRPVLLIVTTWVLSDHRWSELWVTLEMVLMRALIWQMRDWVSGRESDLLEALAVVDRQRLNKAHSPTHCHGFPACQDASDWTCDTQNCLQKTMGIVSMLLPRKERTLTSGSAYFTVTLCRVQGSDALLPVSQC